MRTLFVVSTFFIASFLVLEISAAKKCRRRNPIRYQIERFTGSSQRRFESRSSQVILNDLQDAVNVRIQDSISALRNGMLKIDENIQEFFANGIGLKKIEPGVFDSQQKINYHIHLDNNLLTVIRKGTFKNLGIVVLDLFANKITTIEDGALDGLKDLTTLNLYSNQIVEFSGRSIINSQKLFFFDISFNRIKRLTTPNTFSFMLQDQVVHLLLEDNQITEISPAALGPLRGFATLNLTNNLLTNLPSGLFSTFLLGDVLLANNNLATLPEALFTINTQDTEVILIDLTGNRFNCELQGRLADLRNRTRVNVKFDSMGDCANPNKLDDTVLSYFNATEFR